MGNNLEVKLHFVNWMSSAQLVFCLKNNKLEITVKKNYSGEETEIIKEP